MMTIARKIEIRSWTFRRPGVINRLFALKVTKKASRYDWTETLGFRGGAITSTTTKSAGEAVERNCKAA